MPKKLSSPSQHGSRSEKLYARRITPVNKTDFQLSNKSSVGLTSRFDAMSQGASNRAYQRYTKLFNNDMTGDDAHDNRTVSYRTKLWTAQEQLRADGWSAPELTSLSKNYADAAQYHSDKGSYKKAEHFHVLSKAAKQEATTAKRVATAAKNKADRAARVKTASERVAAKKLAKAAKTSQPKSKPKK
jgi:hypothetical protein